MHTGLSCNGLILLSTAYTIAGGAFMIEVRLFATLRNNRGKIIYLEPEKYTDGMQVLEHFQISREDVAIFLVNGSHSDPSGPIKDGDILAIFPPVGGG